MARPSIDDFIIDKRKRDPHNPEIMERQRQALGPSQIVVANARPEVPIGDRGPQRTRNAVTPLPSHVSTMGTTIGGPDAV